MNDNHKIRPHGLILISLLLIFFGTVTLAVAQKGLKPTSDKIKINELPAESVGEKASELLKRINRISSDGKRYTSEMKKASKEDRLVLELQLFSLQNKAAYAVYQLIDELLVLEEKSPQPTLRKEIEKILLHALPRLKFHISHLRDEIDDLRASLSKATPDKYFRIEIEVARYTERLDALLDINLRVLQKKKQMGMDTAPAQEEFVKLLYDRSDELSGRIKLALSRIENLTALIAQIPDDTDAAKLLAASKKSLNTKTASMKIILGLMDELELNTESLRGELMTATQDYSSGLTDTGVALRLANRTFTKIKAWSVENGPEFILKLIVVVVIIFFFRFVTRIVRKGLKKAIDATHFNLSQLARRMVVNTISNLIMLFGVMLALSQLGISLGPLLAGLGVAGFIVGFALQDTLGNFASGMMILLYRPYDLGDLVEIGDVLGKVNKMNMVSTSLLTVDNQLIVIPNNKIWGDVIKNITAQDIRRVDMVFGISYSDDIPKAESILEDILKSHSKVLDTPESMVRLHTLGASSVDFVVRPWVKVDDYWDVYWDVTRTVKLRFDAEGVSIPFPQRDVHIYNENGVVTETD